MNKVIVELKKMCKDIKLLFVEDEKEARESMQLILKNFFNEMIIAKDGEEGIKKFNNDIDLIITDINMPKIDGLEMARRIKEKKDVAIIIVSAYQNIEFMQKSIEIGVDGYIFKPANINLIVKTLFKVCKNIKIKKENEQYKNHLEELVKEKTNEILHLNREIIKTQKEIIFLLGGVVESRSKETINHVKRVGIFSGKLARLYGLDANKVFLIKNAAPLHDVGKIGIPDSILYKPGKLTNEEFEIIKKHTLIGYELLKNSKLPILKTAAIIAKEHHENYDGSGYPFGLKREEISIEGRIVALTDVFDALSSKRSYKEAWEIYKVVEFIKENKAKKFDPNLVDLLIDNLDEFIRIKEELKDEF